MSARRKVLLLMAGGWLMSHVAAITAEPVRLTHNPFSRPPSASPSRIGEGATRSSRAPQVLDLRATMVGRNSRLADVAGQILRPGDELNGYTLLQVFEDRAVFDIDGKHLTIYVKPELARDDE